MHAILVQKGLVEELKMEEITSGIDEKDYILEKAHRAIIICLIDKPLREGAREKSPAAMD